MKGSSSKKGLSVAIVGATGAVGTQLLKILESRKFPIATLVPFATERSVGKELRCGSVSGKCKVLTEGCFKGVDVAFFDASDAVSKQWVPRAAEEGAWVVDNSAAFRMEDDVPLGVPEVNGKVILARVREGAKNPRARIFAGPNCSTVQLVVALKPIHDRWGLKRVVVSTYQSTSGAGTMAVTEMHEQTRTVLAGGPAKPEVFPHPIAFNCIPHVGTFRDDGYTGEEHKMLIETRKIMGLPELRFTATTVRIPTGSCHSESVNVELEKPFEVDDVRKALREAPGIEVQDNPSSKVYPMPVLGAGKDPVYVGRLRRDTSVPNGLNLWVVSDNLRKGAALNAVQIGEMILEAAF